MWKRSFQLTPKCVKFSPIFAFQAEKNMSYNLLKMLHILSAALLIASAGISYYFWRNRAAIRSIQTQSWAVIVPAAFFQLMTGFYMMSLKHYHWTETWIKGSVLGFMILMISWFAFLYCLMVQNTRKLQAGLLMMASITLLSMIFFMANKI